MKSMVQNKCENAQREDEGLNTAEPKRNAGGMNTKLEAAEVCLTRRRARRKQTVSVSGKRNKNKRKQTKYISKTRK